MKKVIKVLIIVLIILIFAIVGAFAYLYFGTDIFKTDKQMFLKYVSESKDFIYNQLKDEDLDNYKKKLQNTPYENNGKISISYDTESSNKTNEMKLAENSNIAISGKVDKTNKINLQNIKVNYPQSKGIDIDVLAQDDMYGFRINNILKNYIVIENSNLQEWVKELGLNEELIKLIPNKIDSNLIDSIISEDEVNQLVEKYTKLVINELNDDMFSKTNQDNTTVYSLKINETQLNNIAKRVLETAKEDEAIWQVIRRVFTNLSIYSEEEVDNKIDEFKNKLEDYINDYSEENTDEADFFENTTTDSSKEEKIYVYNLYIEDKELTRIESVNDDQSQIISKTENGISIEITRKDIFSEEEYVSALNIEKNKEEGKLIYNIEALHNSELLGSMSIGYRGLDSLNQVEEIAVLEYNLDLKSETGILKRAQEARQKNMSGAEKDEIMLSINEILTQKITDKYTTNNTNVDTSITLNDLKQKFMNKNFEFFENVDGTFKIISKDTNNEYNVASNGKVETTEAEIQESVETEIPKRKVQYFNKNTFNDNLQINRIEDDEIWKMNGKDAKQIGNVFNNISTKMEDINKEQMQNNTYNENTVSSLSLGLIPYFSIVGIDNFEYEQITVKNVATVYAGALAGIVKGGELMIYYNALNTINNSSLE